MIIIKALKISKIYIDINENDEYFAKDENGEIVEYPLEEITNKLTEAAEEGIEVDVTIKQHKERKKSELKKRYQISCDCKEFKAKFPIHAKCLDCGEEFISEEI